MFCFNGTWLRKHRHSLGVGSSGDVGSSGGVGSSGDVVFAQTLQLIVVYLHLGRVAPRR